MSPYKIRAKKLVGGEVLMHQLSGRTTEGHLEEVQEEGCILTKPHPERDSYEYRMVFFIAFESMEGIASSELSPDIDN